MSMISTTDPRQCEHRDWLSDFHDPPSEFRPVPFWSWNEVIEPAEVRRQLRLLADAGCGGAFMHSRKGLITPYLGDEWFSAVGAVIDECRTLGLKVWLYDEDTWPSGFSGGTVPLASENFRPTAIFAAPVGATVPEGSKALGEPCEGLQLYRYIEPLGNPRFNGTTYINPLHRKTVATFIEHAYEPYYRRFGDDYGSLIPAAFTDEPSCFSLATFLPEGAVPYAPELPDRFRALHGYDPTQHLHLLFVDSPGAARFRLHYYRTVSDLFTTNFTQQIADWCEARRISFTGHYLSEDKLSSQQAVGTLVAPQHRHMHIPGVDHLGRQAGERISAKVCQSAVNQFAKPRMLSELYGAAGQHLSFADRAWIAKQQISLGVNLLVPHLALYTMSGCRKRDYPASLYYQQPWWSLNRSLEDELSRLCVAMSQGIYASNVLVLHPLESAYVAWQAKTHEQGVRTNRVMHQPAVEQHVLGTVDAIDSHTKAIVDALLGARIGFDFGEEGALADVGEVDAHPDGPRLRVGAMRYTAVVLPAMLTIRASTFELLRRFTDRGGVVLRCGATPKLLDGEPSADLDAWTHALPQADLATLPGLLAETAPQPVELVFDVDVSADIAAVAWLHTRHLNDGDLLVYLVNLDRATPITGTLRIREPWRSATVLDTRTGDRRTVSFNGELPLRLEPVEHLLLCLSRRPVRGETPLATSARGDVTSVDLHQARVERIDDNAMTLDMAFWREGNGPWSSRPLPVIAIQQRLDALRYDGPLTLRYVVKSRGLSTHRKVHLIVEYPERFRLRINGREASYAGLPAWRDIRWLPINVTGLLCDGDNSIELHCADFRHGDPGRFDDPAGRYGTEIEAIYLVGDFSVTGEATAGVPRSSAWNAYRLPPQPVYWLDPRSLALVEPAPLKPGDVTTQGLPFYAGRLRWALPINSIRDVNDLALRVESFDAAAVEVALNNVPIGHLFHAPSTLRIPSELIRGDADLQLILYGTLRNLLGPHHHPDGEMPWVSPQHFSPWPYYPNHPDLPSLPEAVQAWAHTGQTPKMWRDAYSVVSFGAVGNITLVASSFGPV